MFDNRLIRFIALVAALCASIGNAAAFDETKYPDWKGQWRRSDSGPLRYDPGKPVGLGQQAPLTEEYRAIHAASIADQVAGGHGNDPTFVGYSVGKWLDTDGDGRYDVLEIETRHVRGPRTWDQLGLPMADDNEAVLKERIYLDKSNPNILHNEITTTDNSLMRPWTVTKNYRRELKEITWEENNCVEGNAYITINKQVYVVSGDGLLMPSKKDQPPPDARYFKQTGK